MSGVAAGPSPRAGVFELLLWVAASAVVVIAALSWLPAVFDGQQFYPLGADSFYHARRILDAVAAPGQFYQFDPLIHAPDGSLLTWPWAYDLLAAWLVRAALALGIVTAPMQVLVYVPVAVGVANTALVIALGRAFQLPRWALVMLASAYALSPLTRELHAVGQLDHHFLEQLFYFAALLTGMRWLRAAEPSSALLAGTVLGFAPAFHNGLFVLQILLVAALALLWLRGLYTPGRSARHFAGALVVSTLAILLPSLPFQRGETGFYYLGWFHSGAACASAATALLLPRFTPRLRSLLVAGALLILGGLLTANQIVHGGRFVFAEMPALRDVTEAHSVLELILRGDFAYLTERYSALLWLLPAIWSGLALLALRTRDAALVFAAISLAGGSFLLLQQLRLHYFGMLALCLPPLLLAARAVTGLEARHRPASIAALGILLTVAVWPGVRTFGSYPPFAGDLNYAANRALFVRLGAYCARAPGVVLARFGDGHYLRYHTDCRSIANNMIMTEQHLERIAYTEARFAESAATLRESHRWINYVYVERQDNPLQGMDEEAVRAANPRLVQDLLLAPSLPPGFDLLGETTLTLRDGRRTPLARIVRVR